LNTPPTTLDGALARTLLLDPIPSECYEFLPADLSWRLLDMPPEITNPGPSVLRNSNALSSSELQALDLKYPTNRGRPGGKLHLDPSGAYRATKSSSISRSIARLL